MVQVLSEINRRYITCLLFWFDVGLLFGLTTGCGGSKSHPQIYTLTTVTNFSLTTGYNSTASIDPAVMITDGNGNFYGTTSQGNIVDGHY